ncbi:aminotransferase class V-fold PLP-dependent enzyme [Corynebacterium sp. AOP36-E1-14]|uniref:aminotransferase class V-fold PLP-dependent enzyme n=1 Tax=Corynebacterium sp. AOP36-E1-14 TaxID=3457682 RepID=UPI0040349C97
MTDVNSADEPYTDYAYFDTAAAAPPVQGAVDAAVDYLRKTGEVGPYLPQFRSEIYARVEEIRAETATLFQAEPEEIAFTRNGTEAICLVARGLQWVEGDEIIVPDTEMLSNVAIWRLLEQEVGIKVVTVEAGATGVLDPGQIADAITDRTRLITFASLSNVTGVVQPVRDICEVAAARGVLTHVDAAQSLGIVPLGFDDWSCDFISACTRKGLRGIEGSGVLAVRSSLVEQLRPTLAGWWNSSIDPTTGDVTFPTTARRLEAGSPNVPAVLALGGAVEAAQHVGVDHIHQTVHELTDYAAGRLRALGDVDIYGPEDDSRRLGIIPFNLRTVDSDQLTRSLEDRGIIIESGHFMAGPILAEYGIEKMARISLNYFNTSQEIDRLVDAISTWKE